MEDREFAICFQKLIANYRQTPEENERQFAGILRRIGISGYETHDPEENEERIEFGRNHP